MTFQDDFQNDLGEVFFNPTSFEFAEIISYHPNSGAGAYTLPGIFDISVDIHSSDGGSRLETRSITVLIREADLRTMVSVKDQIIIGKKLYGLTEPPMPEHGVLSLTLVEISDAPAA